MTHEEDKKSEKESPKEEDKKNEQPKTRTSTLSFGQALDRMVKKKPEKKDDCEEKED